jgi:hypothetical protein
LCGLDDRGRRQLESAQAQRSLDRHLVDACCVERNLIIAIFPTVFEFRRPRTHPHRATGARTGLEGDLMIRKHAQTTLRPIMQ